MNTKPLVHLEFNFEQKMRVGYNCVLPINVYNALIVVRFHVSGDTHPSCCDALPKAFLILAHEYTTIFYTSYKPLMNSDFFFEQIVCSPIHEQFFVLEFKEGEVHFDPSLSASS